MCVIDVAANAMNKFARLILPSTQMNASTSPQHQSISSSNSHGPVFHRREIMNSAAKFALYSSGTGLFVASLQNALSRRSLGATGVLTRFGSTIALFSSFYL